VAPGTARRARRPPGRPTPRVACCCLSSRRRAEAGSTDQDSTSLRCRRYRYLRAGVARRSVQLAAGLSEKTNEPLNLIRLATTEHTVITRAV
jgi:hypothetical protein